MKECSYSQPALTFCGKWYSERPEVADCEDHIAKNDESMKEETGIRTKENGEYQVHSRLRGVFEN